MEREKMRLDFERLGQAVIPDRIIGPLDLYGKGKLRGDHAIGKGGGKMTVVREAPSLDGRGAGYGNHGIEMGFGGCFKQKRNIDGKPLVPPLLADALSHAQPLAADGGVKDGLERFPFRRIGKDDGSQRRSQQGAHGVKYRGTKLLANGLKDIGIGRRQPPRDGVAIENAQGWAESSQTPREERLACGYATRDTQYWHAAEGNPA
jgi:hypothetical protein